MKHRSVIQIKLLMRVVFLCQDQDRNERFKNIFNRAYTRRGRAPVSLQSIQ